MWLTLLANKAVQVAIYALLVFMALAGLTFMAYRWGGSGQRADDATAQIKHDIELRDQDAKRHIKAPINASNAVTDKWLLQHVGR